MAYPPFVSTLFLWKELECCPLSSSSAPLSRGPRVPRSPAGPRAPFPARRGRSPGASCLWPCWDGGGRGRPEPARPCRCARAGSGSAGSDVSAQSARNPLGMLSAEKFGFSLQAHTERRFKVKKMLSLDAKKTYKCDRKGPCVLATRNENKGWFKILCFQTALISSLKLSDEF